mmetsp:Transcript_30264/g.71237  ORF Transcript_30264/g.71237 Transcript_30264/m.71237 type:complete len:228 (+) Transcript_30264:158-841(+)
MDPRLLQHGWGCSQGQTCYTGLGLPSVESRVQILWEALKSSTRSHKAGSTSSSGKLPFPTVTRSSFTNLRANMKPSCTSFQRYSMDRVSNTAGYPLSSRFKADLKKLNSRSVSMRNFPCLNTMSRSFAMFSEWSRRDSVKQCRQSTYVKHCCSTPKRVKSTHVFPVLRSVFSMSRSSAVPGTDSSLQPSPMLSRSGAAYCQVSFHKAKASAARCMTISACSRLSTTH